MDYYYQILKVLSSFSLAFSTFSCSNELILEVESNPIPIVYCFLNPMEEDQYVRVGKTFSQSSDNSLDSLSGSLSWPTPPSVYIARWKNGNASEIIDFDIIEGSRRDSGLFPDTGLLLFNAAFKPSPGEEYHLFVHFPELDKIVSGSCQVLSIPEVIDPELVPGRLVSFDTISNYTIRWIGGEFSGVYQGVFKMYYSESINDSYELHSCYFPSPVYLRKIVGDVFEEELTGSRFLQEIAAQIDPIPNVKREIVNFEFMFYSGGDDLALLISRELGIGYSFSEINNISNISGGMGIFSSIACQRFPNLEPSNSTRYFLATSQYTRNLGFQ